ncbi:hypothetical protein FMM82_12585 [[Clostridium] clostridioforme]|nr:hypothetical protein [Enterocloster clostridioformis]
MLDFLLPIHIISYVIATHTDKGHIHNHTICAPIPGRSESAITSGQRVVSC